MSNSMRDLISGEAELDDEEDDESFDEETGEDRGKRRPARVDDSSEEEEDDDDEEEARKVCYRAQALDAGSEFWCMMLTQAS
jgi:transcription elongation factor SPT6